MGEWVNGSVRKGGVHRSKSAKCPGCGLGVVGDCMFSEKIHGGFFVLGLVFFWFRRKCAVRISSALHLSLDVDRYLCSIYYYLHSIYRLVYTLWR